MPADPRIERLQDLAPPVRITVSHGVGGSGGGTAYGGDGGGGGSATVIQGYASQPGEWIWVKSPGDWFMEFHMIRHAGDLLTACGKPRGTPVVSGSGGGVCCEVCFSSKSKIERLQALADASSGDSRLDAMKAEVVKDKVRELLSE